jgi:hypothetical protein
LRSKSSKTIVVVADIHDGNINAVCTPEAARRIPHKRKRKLADQLYEGWQWCIDQLSKKETDLLIVNGDAIDGSNYKDLGSEVWTTSMGQQADDCVELLKEYRYRNVICTTGSGYHVKRGNDEFEEILSKALITRETDGRISKMLRDNGIPNVVEIKEGNTRVQSHLYRYTDYKWKFKALNEIFSVTHHIGFSQVEFYRSTPLAREMVTTELDSYKFAPEDTRPTILIRSHAHYYVMLDYSGSTGIITPAWKFPDEYLHRKGIGGTLPSIGTIEIILEPNGEKLIKKHLVKGVKYPREEIPDITPYL